MGHRRGGRSRSGPAPSMEQSRRLQSRAAATPTTVGNGRLKSSFDLGAVRRSKTPAFLALRPFRRLAADSFACYEGRHSAYVACVSAYVRKTSTLTDNLIANYTFDDSRE